MTFDPYLAAPMIIQIHAGAASTAVLLGPVILGQSKDRMHKVLGYVWVLAMAAAALSAFFIHSFPLIGPFSPIHGLAILTLWSLWTGIRHAIAGRIAAHRETFRSLYWYGLLIAGAFNFLPGRASNRAVFPDNPDAGYILLGAILAVLGGKMLWDRRRKAQLSDSATFMSLT